MFRSKRKRGLPRVENTPSAPSMNPPKNYAYTGNGRILLGASAAVTINDCGWVIRYRSEDGELLSTLRVIGKTRLEGDAIIVPFYGDASYV